jgi:PPE-repeat protein
MKSGEFEVSDIQVIGQMVHSNTSDSINLNMNRTRPENYKTTSVMLPNKMGVLGNQNSNFGNASQKTPLRRRLSEDASQKTPLRRQKMSLSQTPAIQNTMSSLAPEYLPGLI